MQNKEDSSFPLEIRAISVDDLDWLTDFLAEHWGGTEMVSRGKAHYPDELSGFIAFLDENAVGVITYKIVDNDCEIITLNSLSEGLGVGTALVRQVMAVCSEAKCGRLWAVTTNDNCNALRFYQTRGFILAALHPNAIEKSRQIKPDIPAQGFDNIPIRDEIEIEMRLG